MDRDDDLDPTRVLDGWRADRGNRPTDAELMRLLDGWQPGGVPGRGAAQEPPSLRLPRLQPVLDAPVAAVELDAVGRKVARRAARWAATEVTDVELDWQPAPQVAPVVTHPRLLAQWQPGAWVAAVKQVAAASTEVRDGPSGPVVETFGALRLLAWWPPAEAGAPLDRWPQRALLQAVEPERLPEALLAPLPAQASVWCVGEAADWGLIGQIVLLHDTSVQGRSFEALQAFVDAEREAQFSRLNDGYHRPAAGQPVEQH
ncbi:hypothetical protein [Aquincola sp. J276]|uniref:hypothetical protein n=1 Tax=Aquincola sp. J276 TaxID=2898432 RepID=UPI00215190B3|nr:hypothetical protein [Aquincola sp. J276]MCR5866819.1 hypothetical protein [Aquincola sp. J276]